MLIGDIANSGAIPALEATVTFAARRQEIIAGNIANFTTPDYVQRDVNPRTFRAELARAIDARREPNTPLQLRRSDEISIDPAGRMTLTPKASAGEVLFQDRNNRDVERTMQSMAENGLMFRAATELLRTRYDLLRTAIAQRA